MHKSIGNVVEHGVDLSRVRLSPRVMINYDDRTTAGLSHVGTMTTTMRTVTGERVTGARARVRSLACAYVRTCAYG